MWLILLGEVRQRREDEDAHGQKEHEQAELLVGVSQRESERLQARWVAGQFEDSQDAHNAEYLDNSAHILELVRPMIVRLEQEQGQEVRYYC